MDTPTDGKTALEITLAAKRSQVELVSDTTQLPQTTVQPAFFKPDIRTPEQKAADEERWEQDRRENALRYRREQRAALWDELGKEIGPDYHAADLGGWRFHGTEQQQQLQREVLAKVESYLSDFRGNIESGRNLILMGPLGTGKDRLMASVMKAAVMQWGRNVVWRNGTAMYAEFRETMNPASDRSEFGLIQELSSAHILAISDPLPPSGALSEFQATTLFSIVDARYRAHRPTFFTLNVLNRAEAHERMGPQIVDRIAHRALTLFCNWGSYREFERMEAAK